MRDALLDLFFVAGLATMTYGLWLWRPWVALTVCGAIIMGTCVAVTVRTPPPKTEDNGP